jgi:hypothetical protein
LYFIAHTLGLWGTSIFKTWGSSGRSADRGLIGNEIDHADLGLDDHGAGTGTSSAGIRGVMTFNSVVMIVPGA